MKSGRIEFKTLNNLNETDTNTDVLSIMGGSTWVKNLNRFKNVRKLYISTVKLPELELIFNSYPDLEFLYLYNVQIKNLSIIEKLDKLAVLVVEWNTKLESLWQIDKNLLLKELHIRDLKRLSQLDKLKSLQNLEILEISGGMWNKIEVESLEPISKLPLLKDLELGNLKVLSGGIKPIANLIGLKELNISNQFDTEEYAYLAAKMINTKCNMFSGYIKLKHEIGGNDVMIAGKRKPFLNSITDKEKIQSYVDHFEILKKKFTKN